MRITLALAIILSAGSPTSAACTQFGQTLYCDNGVTCQISADLIQCSDGRTCYRHGNTWSCS